MQISSASRSRAKTKLTSLCSRHRRAELNTYFKHKFINGDKLNELVRKTKSTKGETNKEDEKEKTGLN